MAQRRMVSRQVSLSKKLARISWQDEVIWYRCLPFTDDKGRMTADPEEVRAVVIPMGKGGKQIPVAQVQKSLERLHDIGLIKLAQTNGQPFMEFNNFDRFQTLKKDREPKVDWPSPEDSESIGIQRNPKTSLKGKGREGEVKLREVYIYWNNQEYLITHQAFTKEMQSRTSARHKEGFSIEHMMTKISEYDTALSLEGNWWHDNDVRKGLAWLMGHDKDGNPNLDREFLTEKDKSRLRRMKSKVEEKKVEDESEKVPPPWLKEKS